MQRRCFKRRPLVAVRSATLHTGAMMSLAALMPAPADRVARRLGRSVLAPVQAIAIRALSQLRAPEQTQAPADRTARRL